MPIVHPPVPVAVVAVDLILEAVTYLMSHSLTSPRGIGPSREGEHTNLVVDATAFGNPIAGRFESDNHLVGVGFGLTLIDGDESKFVGVHLKYLVGSGKDIRHGFRRFVTIALLPEDHPVLGLHGPFVTPLVVIVLEFGIGSTGTAAAVDFLIYGSDASVEGVDGAA